MALAKRLRLTIWIHLAQESRWYDSSRMAKELGEATLASAERKQLEADFAFLASAALASLLFT